MDREYHASASLGGYLYCISSDTAERFDPVSEAWCLIEPMPLTCENLQAVGAKVITEYIYILCIFQHMIREFCMLLAHLKLKMDPEILLYLNSTRQQVAGHITKLIHLRFGQFAL